MTRIRLPYHLSHQEADIPSADIRGILSPAGESSDRPSLDEQRERVDFALDHPIGSPALETLALGKKTATLITSDPTRPVPSAITLPLILERLRKGNPDIDITILVATGCHRATTHEEMRSKFGEAVVEREKFFMHVSTDSTSLRFVGHLPSGGELWLNKLALDTDLLIAEGFIEPHFFAGFSGGRKSVLPGVAGRETVLANHCSKFIADPRARAGNLEGNPIHKDMLFAARQARLAFILNVTLNPDKSIRAAFAGHPELAHEEGCRHMRDSVTVPRVEGDIVITSNGGYPLDQNLYQAVKGMTAAEACCADGGTIIMVAGCSDGHGGEPFYRALAEAKSPQALLDAVRLVPQDKTVPDQWEYQILARILSKFRVILVTDMWDARLIRALHMDSATTLAEAVAMARRSAQPGTRFVVIPDGVSVIVERAS